VVAKKPRPISRASKLNMTDRFKESFALI